MSSGFFFVNKPEGPTSFDIIRQLRRQVGIKKMGHAGTLDPLASGLLIVAVGQATKLLPQIPVNDKIYEFTLHFGEERDTGDRAGEIVELSNVMPLQESLEAILPQFIGEITQTPPSYSAIKIDGQRAYDRARRGEEVVMPSRKVTIYSLHLLSYDATQRTAVLSVHCSSGTYVRSLCQDIARGLGSVGYAATIHRVAIGPFSLSRAKSVEEFTSADQMIAPQDAVPIWPTVELNEHEYARVIHGNTISTTHEDAAQVWVLYNKTLLALASIQKGTLKVVRLFHENFL